MRSLGEMIMATMTPEEGKLLTEYDERLARMMEQAHASSLFQLEGIKLRIAHHEKVVVLCAGTLALTFTAATAFHGGHGQELAALSSLRNAWELLLGAIVLSVISNWLSVNGVSHLGNSFFRKQIGVRFTLLEQPLKKLDPLYAEQERKDWNACSAKYADSEKYSHVLIRLAAGIGACAQILAFCAFVSLYYFASAVLAG